MIPRLGDVRIAVIGLGYVGLPLAVYMARHFPVVGFDIDAQRIAELKRGSDRTREITADEVAQARHLTFSSDRQAIAHCNFYVISVPTPIDQAKRPDFAALVGASRTVGAVLKRDDIVVYESTVYPGATEEICVPVLGQTSNLKFNQDFFVGYSPERINPGDHAHRLPDIVKVTSGSTPDVADLVDAVYAKVVTAGTHKASSIRVAEAAKVIENIQRDVNIALVNELTMLFKELGLESREVLTAAGTKWNFQPFRPGLVGGHCIGVDPYYLTHKAESIGFHPQMILAGRRVNDSMATYIATDILKMMLKRKIRIDAASVLVMGITFKENCPDTRNTKVANLVRELAEFVPEVAVYDPLADPEMTCHEYQIKISNELPSSKFDAVVLAVKHEEIVALGKAKIGKLLKPGGLIYDVKGVLPANESDARI
jgi:UDP-N-acetyl-D-glucosamine/UDP-N-acetyl-D-galactosamine dehydrogenase